jgi:bifunctional ADP-heptose synthase (sugar kinase/adenylyltransferase)
VFDAIHLGHVTLIGHAADLAQSFGVPLVALLNSDQSLGQLRRAHQHSEDQRATLVRRVANAEVRFFDGPDPTDALQLLAADFAPGYTLFLKGADTVNTITSPPELGLPGVLYGFVPLVPGQYGQKLATRSHLKVA